MKKEYRVKYTKVFIEGMLKGLSVECSLGFPTLDSATRFVGALGGPDRIHEELLTKGQYYAINVLIKFRGLK